MSTTTTLSAGVQQIYNAGLLPSSLSTSTLGGATSGQLNKIVASTIASEQVSALWGMGSNSDTAGLSSTAENALLQEINPTSTSSASSSTTDPLTAAVDNALTSSLNAAVNKFASPTTDATGTNVNVVG